MKLSKVSGMSGNAKFLAVCCPSITDSSAIRSLHSRLVVYPEINSRFDELRFLKQFQPPVWRCDVLYQATAVDSTHTRVAY